MSSLKPYGGSSALRLTSLVNKANNKNFVYGVDLTFGLPIVASGADYNTKVSVIPLRDLKRFKSVDVSYLRLPIGAVNELPEGFTQPVPIYKVPFSLHEILPRINKALGVDLTPQEVENVVYDSVEPSYNLSIKDGSLAWLASSATFKAEHVKDIPLESILTVTVLGGLIYKQK